MLVYIRYRSEARTTECRITFFPQSKAPAEQQAAAAPSSQTAPLPALASSAGAAADGPNSPAPPFTPTQASSSVGGADTADADAGGKEQGGSDGRVRHVWSPAKANAAAEVCSQQLTPFLEACQGEVGPLDCACVCAAGGCRALGQASRCAAVAAAQAANK